MDRADLREQDHHGDGGTFQGLGRGMDRADPREQDHHGGGGALKDLGRA